MYAIQAVTPLQSLPPGTEDFRATYQHQQSRQNAWDGSQEVHRPMPGVSANALPSIMTLSSMEAVRQKTAREAIQSGLSSKVNIPCPFWEECYITQLRNPPRVSCQKEFSTTNFIGAHSLLMPMDSIRSNLWTYEISFPNPSTLLCSGSFGAS